MIGSTFFTIPETQMVRLQPLGEISIRYNGRKFTVIDKNQRAFEVQEQHLSSQLKDISSIEGLQKILERNLLMISKVEDDYKLSFGQTEVSSPRVNASSIRCSTSQNMTKQSDYEAAFQELKDHLLKLINPFLTKYICDKFETFLSSGRVIFVGNGIASLLNIAPEVPESTKNNFILFFNEFKEKVFASQNESEIGHAIRDFKYKMKEIISVTRVENEKKLGEFTHWKEFEDLFNVPDFMKLDQRTCGDLIRDSLTQLKNQSAVPQSPTQIQMSIHTWTSIFFNQCLYEIPEEISRSLKVVEKCHEELGTLTCVIKHSDERIPQLRNKELEMNRLISKVQNNQHTPEDVRKVTVQVRQGMPHATYYDLCGQISKKEDLIKRTQNKIQKSEIDEELDNLKFIRNQYHDSAFQGGDTLQSMLQHDVEMLKNTLQEERIKIQRELFAAEYQKTHADEELIPLRERVAIEESRLGKFMEQLNVLKMTIEKEWETAKVLFTFANMIVSLDKTKKIDSLETMKSGLVENCRRFVEMFREYEQKNIQK